MASPPIHLNLKAFWKYINSKRETKIGIGDLSTVDVDGDSITVSSSMEKAEVLRNFFLACLQSKRDHITFCPT